MNPPNVAGIRLAILLLARIYHMNAPRMTPGPAHDESLERCGHPTCVLFQDYLGLEG